MNNARYFFEIWPWLGLFAAIVLSWYFYLKARNKERMALIERGADVSDIYSKKEVVFRFPWLKIGIVIIGICIGLIIPILLVYIFPDNFSFIQKFGPGPGTLLSGFLFGGISLIIVHFVDRPRQK